LALAAVALILLVVPHGNTPSTTVSQALKQVDFGGSFTLLVSVGALLQLLSLAGTEQPLFRDPFSITMAVVFVIFFLLFILVELKMAVRPVLPLSMLSRRTPLCVGIIAGGIAIVNFNMLYHLP
jgi:hypothetical protein